MVSSSDIRKERFYFDNPTKFPNPYLAKFFNTLVQPFFPCDDGKY